MRVSVFFDAVFSRMTGTDHAQVEVEEATLGGLAAALSRRFGEGLRGALLAGDGKLASGVTVLQGGRQLDLDSPLHEGEEVAFLVAIAGGGLG